MNMTSNDPAFSVSVNIDHDKCIANKGCRVCVDGCPTDIIEFDPASGQIRMSYDECWYCLPCQHDCPAKAIRVEIPYMVR